MSIISQDGDFPNITEKFLNNLIGKKINVKINYFCKYLVELYRFSSKYSKNRQIYFENDISVKKIVYVFSKSCCNYETLRGIFKMYNGDYVVFSLPDYCPETGEDMVAIFNIFENLEKAVSHIKYTYLHTVEMKNIDF